MSLPSPYTALPPLSGPPYGIGADGEPIRAINGKLIAGTIRHMWELLAERTRREAPPDASPRDVDAAIARVKAESIAQLVEALNERIADVRLHVTPEMLVSEGNTYSREFEFFVVTICRDLSKDPLFLEKRGEKIVPAAVAAVFRPLGIRQSFNFLPRATQKFLDTDIRVVETRARSATIRWYAGAQERDIPAHLRTAWLEWSCPAYKTTYAAIPFLLDGLPHATVEDLRCQLRGDECCEWRFTWESPAPRSLGPLAVGAVASALLLAAAAAGGFGPLPAILSPFPLATGFAIRHLARLRYARERLDVLLAEQRETSEQQLDRTQIALAQLQESNVALTTKIAELTALREVTLAVSTTLDVHEILDRSLEALTRHLHYDRGVVFLLDEKRGVLSGIRTRGLSPEADRTLQALEIPLDDPDRPFAKVAREKTPLFVDKVSEHPHEAVRAVGKLIGTDSYLVAPLVAEGRAVGVLGVDNGLSGRPLRPDGMPLLVAVGSTVAVAILNARLHEEIEEQNRTLEHRVAERTAELEDARRVAEEASRAKSRFLANTSHELRTPLNAVIGYSEMLLEAADESANPDAAADLRKIHAAGKYLLELINALLDLSKIEAGRMEVYTETFDVSHLVRDATATLRPLLERNGNRLELDLPDAPCLLRADLTKTRQILVNLVGNATKFTKAGAVRVSLREAARPGEPIAISVTDTGIGMTREQMSLLFQTFAQGDASTTRHYGGTGLGLALSRHLARLMGGDIAVASEPGAGSTFTVTLPSDAGTPESRVASPRDGSRERRRVLVVDDDPSVRELMRRILEKEGFDADLASSGPEALEKAREIRPDAITLDVLMPEVDGWSVLSALKADPDLSRVPVVLLSMTDERSLGYALGAADYLLKPVERERVREALHRCLDGRAPGRVLVVDDDPDARERLRRLVLREGGEVDEASDGREALELLKRSPSLVFLDLAMPVMDGFEFLVEARRTGPLPPVVVLTARDVSVDERDALNGSVRRVLQKGQAGADTLVAEIRRALGP